MAQGSNGQLTDGGGTGWRVLDRESAARRAIAKREAGFPTFTVPEAAALLSISQEHLYRLIRAGAFPAVRMRTAGTQGRYVVPSAAVERLLDAAAPVEVAEFTAAWSAGGDAA